MAGEALKRFIPSKSATTTSPLPEFDMPPMPERLRKISPELEQWESALKNSLQRQLRAMEEKLNAVIDTQKSGA